MKMAGERDKTTYLLRRNRPKASVATAKPACYLRAGCGLKGSIRALARVNFQNAFKPLVAAGPVLVPSVQK
jgi:hypothetical protein